MHDALAAGQVRARDAGVDRRRALGPVRRRDMRSPSIQAHGVESMLVTEEEIEEAFRFLYSARSSRASPPERWLLRRSWPGRAGDGPTAACCLRRQRGGPNCLCYPGSAMKTGIHPEYVMHARPLLLRRRVRDPFDAGGDPRRRLLGLPPVLHGQAEADGLPAAASSASSAGWRRPAAPAAASRLGQQHRGTGCPGGRDDAQPFECGLSPSASPTARSREVVTGDQLADGAQPDLPPARRPWRDRARRVARDRLPRARDLGELRGAGSRTRRKARSRPRSGAARSSSRSRSRSGSR